MEKKNNMVIWLLLVIIAILVVLCVLFATNKITINSSNNNNKNILNDTKNNNTSENDNVDSKLNNNEAEAIVKSLFTEETVRAVFDNPQIPNCKTETKLYSEKELGLNYDGNGFYKATNFNSYEEYINNIKSYFTNEYFTKNIENKKTIASKTTTLSNGTVMYNFYEKDGALYCTNTGKGTDTSKANFKEINYNITNINNNEIDASIDASWYGYNYSEGAQEKINIKIVKENDNWKISSYEVQ